MTSQTAVAYVIKARLFVSHALSRATAAARRRIQLGNGNFTDECYQMVLRSHYLPLHQRSEYEPSKISHINLITGYTFLKRVTGFKTSNRLTGSRLTSLIMSGGMPGLQVVLR